jgi:uncharacterized protein YdhG (YjbR/CyaY superfamily)
MRSFIVPIEAKKLRSDFRASKCAAALPNAVKTTRYDMPLYQLDGVTVLYFAIWKKHVGIYPIYRKTAAFELEVAPYRANKDAVRFGLDNPLPVGVIAMIARAQAQRGLLGSARFSVA